MKVLFISYFFPPYNIIGSIRSGKTAKYLNELGVTIQILCGKDLLFPETLDIEIPRKNICPAPWWNVNALPERFLGGKEAVKEKGYSAYAAKRTGPIKSLGTLYKNLFNFPDAHIGWYPFAVRAGSRLIRQNRPDLIFATATPYTGLMVADRLARKFSIPWVGEYRDLWMGNPFWDRPPWRHWLETRLERYVISSARALVTVSEPLAQSLTERHNKPVAVIYNGFDHEMTPSPSPSASRKLSLVYTGGFYENQQDITPLFEALTLLGEKANGIQVNIYGRSFPSFQKLIDQFQVGRWVNARPPVSHEESILVQSKADILLFLLWVNPDNKGMFSGKIFEYLGARRPILAIGSKQTPMELLSQDEGTGKMIEQRNAGVLLNSPNRIAEQLLKWTHQKSVEGEISSLPEDVCKGFSRKEQTGKLLQFFDETLKKAWNENAAS